MKVVTVAEMTRIEKLAYASGGDERSYMASAGQGIADAVAKATRVRVVTLLCGKGNNSGDAYVAGLHLLHRGYTVTALQLTPRAGCSWLCQENIQPFEAAGGKVIEVISKDQLDFPSKGSIIDGIFGTGFQGLIQGLLADAIQAANQSGLPIYSIDIPSGLNGDTGEAADAAIQAIMTFCLGLPKVGLFLRQGWNLCGELVHLPFGINPEVIVTAHPTFELLTREELAPSLPPLVRSRHKYQAGYVVALAGSPGMAGAAALAGSAALHGGAGIVRLLHPPGIEGQVAFPPELIHQNYDFDSAAEVMSALDKASAVLLGPGIGRSGLAAEMLLKVISQLDKPCVIDADALKLIAEHPELQLPKNAVLTPHRGEMATLLGIKEILPQEDHLRLCQQYCDNHQIVLIVKGAPTFILQPGQPPRVNAHGNPGMATAGSGDVLTGLIAALLSQGIASGDAAALGVYLHSVAGDEAARHLTPHCMVASDIIAALPFAFNYLHPVRS